MSAGHWTDAYYGPLYLESVEDLLTPALSALEAGVVARFLRARPGDAVLDAGCGQGRHLGPLAARGLRPVGLDRSAPYLARARAAAPGVALVRADLRLLPFRPGALAGTFSWYASLFMFDDGENAAVLSGLARAVRRGGRVVVQHGNPLRLERHPVESSARSLGGGARVEEDSAWDPRRGVDRCTRRLNRPDGSRLEATAELRYYSPAEWAPLADAAGLRIVEITSTAGEPPGPDAADLVVVLEKPT